MPAWRGGIARTRASNVLTGLTASQWRMVQLRTNQIVSGQQIQYRRGSGSVNIDQTELYRQLCA
jgi:hypothetical protein